MPNSGMRAAHLSGIAEMDENRISLPEELPFSRKVEVFFHELFHLYTGRFPEVTEEIAAIQAGTMMVDFLRGNPKMAVELVQAATSTEEA